MGFVGENTRLNLLCGSGTLRGVHSDHSRDRHNARRKADAPSRAFGAPPRAFALFLLGRGRARDCDGEELQRRLLVRVAGAPALEPEDKLRDQGQRLR